MNGNKIKHKREDRGKEYPTDLLEAIYETLEEILEAIKEQKKEQKK